MSLFDDEMNKAARDMQGAFAEDIYINGRLVQGIVNDQEFIDEIGIRRDVSISFMKSDVPAMQVGDSVIISSYNYKIRQLPKLTRDDPFYTVELIRA